MDTQVVQLVVRLLSLCYLTFIIVSFDFCHSIMSSVSIDVDR